MLVFTIPSALTTNLDGTNVVVPPSHVALRTFAFNDRGCFSLVPFQGSQEVLYRTQSVGFVNPSTVNITPLH